MSSNPLIRSNPALTRGFRAAGTTSTGPMTVEGTVVKTALLLAAFVVAAAAGWPLAHRIGISWVLPVILAAFAVSVLLSYRPHLAPKLALPYAVGEGLAVGAISATYNARFHGIVASAATITVAIFAALLLAYRSGRIRVSGRFTRGIIAATGGIAIFYLITLLVGAFGVTMPLVYSSSPAGIAFSVAVVVLAAANLVVDFDFIDRNARRGAPGYMEWYAAFGLLVTVVWLYLEVLRLLAKLQSRR